MLKCLINTVLIFSLLNGFALTKAIASEPLVNLPTNLEQPLFTMEKDYTVNLENIFENQLSSITQKQGNLQALDNFKLFANNVSSNIVEFTITGMASEQERKLNPELAKNRAVTFANYLKQSSPLFASKTININDGEVSGNGVEILVHVR